MFVFKRYFTVLYCSQIEVFTFADSNDSIFLKLRYLVYRQYILSFSKKTTNLYLAIRVGKTGFTSVSYFFQIYLYMLL